jgi:hypothetical protein
MSSEYQWFAAIGTARILTGHGSLQAMWNPGLTATYDRCWCSPFASSKNRQSTTDRVSVTRTNGDVGPPLGQTFAHTRGDPIGRARLGGSIDEVDVRMPRTKKLSPRASISIWQTSISCPIELTFSQCPCCSTLHGWTPKDTWFPKACGHDANIDSYFPPNTPPDD